MSEEVTARPERTPSLANEIAEAMKAGTTFCTLVAPVKERERVIEQLKESLQEQGPIAMVSLNRNSDAESVIATIRSELNIKERGSARADILDYQTEMREQGKGRVFIIVDGFDQAGKEGREKIEEFLYGLYGQRKGSHPEAIDNTSWLLATGTNIPLFDKMDRTRPKIIRQFQSQSRRGLFRRK